MGYHMTLVGFKSVPKKIRFGSNRFRIFINDFYENRIMYGGDCDMGVCRSPFHDAMFNIDDICFLDFLEDKQGPEGCYVGCFSRKESCLSNFLKWSESKINPFSHLLYFSEAVEVFISAVSRYATDYKYLFWDSSTLYNNLNNPNDKKVERFLKQSCLFYDTIRNGKKADLKVTRVALQGTLFEVKKDKVEYIEWLKDDEIKEVAKKYGIYYFYADI